MILHTENVRFRPIEERDLKLLQDMFNSEEINELTTGNAVPISYAQQLEWYRSVVPNDKSTIRFMVENLEGETIGTTSLTVANPVARIAEGGGVKLLPEFRGKRYSGPILALKLMIAFRELNMRMFCIECLDAQAASMHNLEKHGFTLDGTLRDRVYKNGRYYSVCHWSITRKEYNAKYGNDKK